MVAAVDAALEAAAQRDSAANPHFSTHDQPGIVRRSTDSFPRHARRGTRNHPMKHTLSMHTIASSAIALAILFGGTAIGGVAFAGDVKLTNGATWRGEVGAMVRVTYVVANKSGATSGSGELVAEGKILKLDKSYIRLEVTENGKRVEKTIFDIKKIEPLDAVDVKPASGGSAPSKSAPPKPSGTSSKVASSTTSTPSATTTDGKQKPTIFVLPWEGMVGIGARHEELEQIGKEADKLGPGQIIIIEVISGGGLVTEGDKIDETLNKLRERHRLIAWVHEAISAAAFTSLHCNEIYFQRVGTLGAITMFAGTVSIKGSELVAWQKKVGDVCEGTKRSRWIGEAMVNNEPLLSYDKDDDGNVKWYNTLEGKYKLSDEVQNLTLNASTAEHCKFSQGTADTLDDLLALISLSPENVVVSKVGYDIHSNWQKTIKDCQKAKLQLAADMQNPGGSTAEAQLNSRIKAAKEIRRWFDKCFPVMTYDSPQMGSPEQWDKQIEDLQRQLKQFKNRS